MIHVIQGFKLLTREAVDNRLVLTKAEMAAINDNQMPDKYFAVCKEDRYLYVYDKSREPNNETGRFEQYGNSKIETISINGVELPIDGKNVDLPTATAERYGLIIPGRGLKSINGVLTIDFNAIEDESIPVEKIDFRNVTINANRE